MAQHSPVASITKPIWKITISPFWLFQPTRALLTVWSANRNRPVGTHATLELTVEGDLVMKDADSSVTWSTRTSGKSVAGMNLTDTGNLVLFDKNNAAVQQSFDHPTNTLLLRQKLRVGQKLTPGNSATGHFEVFVNLVRNGSLLSGYGSTAAVQYLKFKPDGHLRVYQQFKIEFFIARDTPTESTGYCGYPMVCGSYGICEEDRTCRCPDRYFKPIDYTDPTLGCAESIPLSCEALQFQSFSDVGGVNCFALRTDPREVLDLEIPMRRVAKRLARITVLAERLFFEMQELALIIQNTTGEAADSRNTDEPPPKNSRWANGVRTVIMTSSLGSLLASIFLLVVIKGLCRRKGVDEVEEGYLDQVPGAPKRFTYDDLKTITKDFNNMVGEGGFSSVYQGTLADGKKVAVKRLNILCRTKKSFLAKVESIGNFHHVTLRACDGRVTPGSPWRNAPGYRSIFPEAEILRLYLSNSCRDFGKVSPASFIRMAFDLL
ncbi:hypothetical protein NL676_001390 [Syzygium grande]|nr:hypothetical protein NL676_001390 [Syzygium grande]